MDGANEDVTHANITLGGKYQLLEVIGQGSFGKIFRASVKGTEAIVAVKVEKHTNSRYGTLNRESKVLTDLAGVQGFPSLYSFGREEKYNFMVTTLLGPNVEKLLKLSGRKFSLKTVLMLADQMLTRIEAFHEHQYIHRDIKPENFVMGLGSSSNNLFVIDFGLAKKFVSFTGGHVVYNENKGLVGTARYASVNAHLGVEQTRRDDLEAIGYTLIYFLKGKLPWQNIAAATKQQKYYLIAQMKLKTPPEVLCEDLPKEFAMYMSYVKKLGFGEVPDYKYLKKLFRTLFLESGYEFDYKYDWTDVLKATQDNRASKHLFGGAAINRNVDIAKLKKCPFSKPKLDDSLHLKSKNLDGNEEEKGAESEEDDATTAKLTKGVKIDEWLRLENNLKRCEDISSENTSKALNLSATKPMKANDDDFSAEEADVDKVSLIFQKLRSFENGENPADLPTYSTKRAITYEKAYSYKTTSKVPRQSYFGAYGTREIENEDLQSK